MLQNKFIYFLLGFFSGYIISSTFLLLSLALVITLVVYIKKDLFTLIKTFVFNKLNHSKKTFPRVSKEKNFQKQIINARIRSEVFSEMVDYCKWKGVTIDLFASQAALLIFTKDKDWKAYNRVIQKKR